MIEARLQPEMRLAAPKALAVLAFIVLTATLYINAILWWKYEWTQPGSYYAHGVFIPVFVGLMIWRDRERLRRLPMSRSWWGLPLVIVAVALVMLAQRAQVPVSLSISFILFLIGSSLLLAGAKITRALLFPMLFLFTMIPMVPDQLINPVAFPIQITSAKMATGLSSLIGFPAVRTGTHIQMEHYLLDVELPCSGFKTLVGLMAFAAAFAYLVEGAAWKRWSLFLTAGPLAILVNGVRITLIALVGEVFGSPAAAAFHDWSGFIVLILGFMFLFGLARLLKCDKFLGMPLVDAPAPAQAGRDEAAGAVEPPAPDTAMAAAEEQRALDARYGAPRQDTLRRLTGGLIPLLGVLVIACAVKPGFTPPKITTKPVGPNDVPVTFAGGWSRAGEDTPIAQVVKEATNPASWLDRNYAVPAPHTGEINLLISAGNGRRVFHDPHTCFLGTGYFLHDIGIERIDTPAGPVTVQLSEAEDPNHQRSLMMFLYVVGGEQLQTTQAVNWSLLWQTLLGDGGKPSYFLRFRHLATGTGKDRHEELRDFVRSVWGEIGPKVTGGAPARPQQTVRR